jgi:hypothetical protein
MMLEPIVSEKEEEKRPFESAFMRATRLLEYVPNHHIDGRLIPTA